MPKKCPICQSPEKNPNLIFQTRYWWFSLANDQYYLGRSFLTAQRHVSSLGKLSKAEWKDFEKLVVRIEKVYAKTFKPALLNWTCMVNGAFQKKPYAPHMHWHIRPRYEKPIRFQGLVFKDKEFGHHYARRTNRKLSKEIQQKIIARLKKYQ
ncbi:MAG: HIT family protein [Candidatus Diapherotrites archaeon]